MAYQFPQRIYSMGADGSTIKYANRVEYNGGTKNRIPEGKGKLTFKNGSTFQGQFIQGEPKNGKIRNGEFVYQGQLVKSQIKGRGMLIDKSNTFYEGLFQNGRLTNGEIIKKNKENDVVATFKGEIENLSPFTSTGTMKIALHQIAVDNYVTEKRTLEGTFKNGNLHGSGKYSFPNGDVYEGQFINGKANNQGQYKSRQFKLTGSFINNHPDGEAIIIFKNGDRYEGKMKQGKMHGQGIYTFDNGTIYTGDFYYGTLWGNCTIQYPKDGDIVKYEGQINEGKYNGIGVIYYSNGVVFKGYFLDGAKNGHGVLIYGKDKYKCLYLMDELSGQMKLIDS